MKIARGLALTFLMLLVGAGISNATSINPSPVSGLSLQQIINGITTAPTPGSNHETFTGTVNSAINYDSYWSIGATGGSVSTVIVQLGEQASSDVVGIYDATDPSNRIAIFSGAHTAGDQAMISIRDDGGVYLNGTRLGSFSSGNLFGYYLQTPGATENAPYIFYSNAALNSDSFDHMVAFQGNGIDTLKIDGLASGAWLSSEYILGFQDTVGGGDYAYNDMVFMVESVTPVPEPGSLFLLGSGLVGLAAYGYRKYRK